jgi:hypothetical protein
MVAAATYQESGFFTPLYHIASTFIEPTAMETSMQRAMEGDLYYLSAGLNLTRSGGHSIVGRDRRPGGSVRVEQKSEVFP